MKTKSKDPLSGDYEFEGIQRQDKHRNDYKELNERGQVNAFCKAFTRGYGMPEVYGKLWKEAKSRRRAFVQINDLMDMLDLRLHVKIHSGTKKDTGISDKVGAYLDTLPSKLITAYEDWLQFNQDLSPGLIAILAFKMPYLKGEMAIVREGGTGEDINGTGRIVFNTEKADYVIQSAYGFGMTCRELL